MRENEKEMNIQKRRRLERNPSYQIGYVHRHLVDLLGEGEEEAAVEKEVERWRLREIWGTSFSPLGFFLASCSAQGWKFKKSPRWP